MSSTVTPLPARDNPDDGPGVALTPRAERGLARQEFTREQVELIKRTVAVGTTDDELQLFLETARRRGLDPFTGQIHAIMRYDSRAGREVMRIQTGIDGYRALAERTGLIEWVAGPEWTADGTDWWSVWLSEDHPAAARFAVKRRDRSKPEMRVATWREYAQTNNKGELTRAWKSLPATMLGKVAEAAALRAALPEVLGGLYTADEMDQSYTPEATTEPTGEDGPAVLVDHPEERADLFDRYGRAYAAIRARDGEDAAKAAHREVKGRLRGATVPDAFQATALFVLAEVVETLEAQAGEALADQPDDAADAGNADASPADDGPECGRCGLPVSAHPDGVPPPDGCVMAASAVGEPDPAVTAPARGHPEAPDPDPQPKVEADADATPHAPMSTSERVRLYNEALRAEGFTPMVPDPPAEDAAEPATDAAVVAAGATETGEDVSSVAPEPNGPQEPSEGVGAGRVPAGVEVADWQAFTAAMDAADTVARTSVDEVIRKCADGEWTPLVTLAVELAGKARRSLTPRLSALVTAEQARLAHTLASAWKAKGAMPGLSATETLPGLNETEQAALRTDLARRLARGLLTLGETDPDARKVLSARLAAHGNTSSAPLDVLAGIVDDLEQQVAS